MDREWGISERHETASAQGGASLLSLVDEIVVQLYCMRA